MATVTKRPIVIQDLIEKATYIAEDNLDAAENFLTAAEATFQKLGNFPEAGKLTSFQSPRLAGVRQYPIKGFKKYLIFYRVGDREIEILRVLHGAMDVVSVLDGSIEL